ncbi:MAG: hypothetical protein A2663_02470 [Candidatus Buchananbacteria bacterium RIFCSPHIGHO2_01_FULL_46_12]|uniref:Uncharacterized protein n=2 Tax=Candidatus Buchananiibacteriota TaxID=1817903 RepID=A0A1G1YCN5_9BACT|nr:MAG: hypothetical protein A2663_02470 [Candidatus Buchananbacteria bacterium RIFCSPHIGHO2_01_FULL_46_12]OGY57337.1 MAG: hypothetical protein A3H67_04310 [Candidatus Buchananbacteria bacterium RIFCSPLOWO2_02_FULL_46_11b]
MAQIDEKNNENPADFSGQATNSEIKKLLEENLKLTREIHSMAKKIKGQLFWQRLFGGLKVLAVIVLLALSFIYLPPLLNNAIAPYQELLNIKAGGLSADSVRQIINQLNSQ